MKRNCLLLGMFCAAVILIVLCGAARAGQDDSSSTSVYATLSGQGAGYDPALGLRIEHTTGKFWRTVSFHGTAKADFRKKYSASEGATYGALAAIRVHLWNAYTPVTHSEGSLYASVGASACGYRSEFPDDRVWSKNAVHPVIGLGWDSGDIDLDLAYYAKEHSTPNEVQALKMIMSAPFYDEWRVMLELTGMDYLNGRESHQEMLWTFGIGYQW